MATRDNLIRVRRLIAEFKIYVTRTQSYLAPFQLFMIFLIFLNTTVWNVEWIQGVFGTKAAFIGVGIVAFLVGVLFLGYIDTKFKVFRVEQGSYNTPDRNPFTPLFVLWTALLLKDKKELDSNLDKKAKLLLKSFGANEMYDEFKNTIKANSQKP